MQLQSYACGQWLTGRDRGVGMRDATSGEIVGHASSTGLEFAAMLSHARNVGGPALRELTFHERAALLKSLAKRLSELKEEFYSLSFRTGATRSDSAIDIANRCAFTPQELRRESYLAIAVCLAALFVIAGAIVWWIQMAQHASSFFSGGAAGLSSSPWSTNLGAALTFMSFGTVAALWGATRVVLSFRANRSLASQDPRS